MSGKVFSGHQPNFLPYMGYIYKMFRSDVFVLDDDVQYSRTEYHNTNYIKVNGNRFKVTVPVSYEFGDMINEVKICYERDWVGKLLKTVQMNYGKAPFFKEGYALLEKHLGQKHEYLVDLNIGLLREIAENFGLGCKIVIASEEVPTSLKNNERNVRQCIALGGDIYYSGVGGKEYNDEELYRQNGIGLVYSDYEPISYRQQGRGFVENLSVIDYIFNQGYSLPKEWREKG